MWRPAPAVAAPRGPGWSSAGDGRPGAPAPNRHPLTTRERDLLTAPRGPTRDGGVEALAVSLFERRASRKSLHQRLPAPVPSSSCESSAQVRHQSDAARGVIRAAPAKVARSGTARFEPATPAPLSPTQRGSHRQEAYASSLVLRAARARIVAQSGPQPRPGGAWRWADRPPNESAVTFAPGRRRAA